MKILVSNDDGIFADGLWTLVSALEKTGEVVVSAPDREQSATGTMVTLRQPLRVRRMVCFRPDIQTYAVEGSPSDSVILAVEKLYTGIDLAVAGINQGLNLGDDVLISGTVGAAMQAYLRGLSALAVSVPPDSQKSTYLQAARFSCLLADAIASGLMGSNVFFNINLPDLPKNQIKGVRVGSLAHKTHIDTVDRGHDGRREYYWLVRRQLTHRVSPETDIWLLEQGYISITPLHIQLFRRPSIQPDDDFCLSLFNRFLD